MLVLTRKDQEWIDMRLPSGEVISICLVRSISGKSRIGIDAPPEVKIKRRELDFFPEEKEGANP